MGGGARGDVKGVQAYFLNKAAVGTTPFVARSLNLAASDPGGSAGVGGHLGPIRGNILSGRRFELWAFTCGRFGTSP